MCAASRALWSVATLGAGCLLATAAWAEEPVISAPPAPSPSAAPAPTVAPAPPPPPSSAAPPFTPAPEPSFTVGAPAPPTGDAAPPAPTSSAGNPAYVAPAYVAPVTSAAPPPTATPAGPAESPKPPALPDPRWNDAHLDRVVLLPTGETHPAGTTYVSSYEIVGLQVGHALNDRMQLTLSFVPPLTKDPIVPIDITLKGVLVRSRRVRVAAMTSATGLFGYESGAAAVGRVGGVTQLCFDDRCESSLNMGASMVFVGPVFIVVDGVGAIVRVTHVVSFLFELQSVLPIGRDGGEIHALGGAAGIRMSGKRLGLDIALEGALDRRTEPRVIPLIVGTYRFLP